MARKPALSVEKLAPLGAEKLARLVLDEAARNAPFRKLVNAALAGLKGPEAVAKIVDRRLAALEKARSFIDWDKAKAFRQDLDATVGAAAGELAAASPAMAVERLLRFTATQESVFERVDDSQGRIQDVYYRAIEAIGEWTARLSQDEKILLPGKVMSALGNTTYGYFDDVAGAVIPHLPESALRAWDGDLEAEMSKYANADPGGERDWDRRVRASQLRAVRQIIASTLDDLDGLIALEEAKHPNTQDTLAIAERLLQAGRLEEALEWVRRPARPSFHYMRISDLADDEAPRNFLSKPQALLEARILEAMGDKPAAQAMRWETFEALLDGDILRAYLDALADFEEFDALDRAFAHALAHERRYLALEFLLQWPRLDLAAKLVVDNHRIWEGRRYHLLAPAAEALEHEYKLAATVLYRALVDDILARARSKAYGHAARDVVRLTALAEAADEQCREAGIDMHATYFAALQKTHGRKRGFWAKVDKT